MAGRIRTIKPELIEDAIVAGLSDTAFRLFIGLIVLADDHGIARASKGYLRGQVWHEAEPANSIESALEELGRKLVRFYEVDGQPYCFVTGWSKHQRVDDGARPRLPLPPGFAAVETVRQNGNRTRSSWAIRPLAEAGGNVPGQTSTGRDRLDPGGNAPGQTSTARSSLKPGGNVPGQTSTDRDPLKSGGDCPVPRGRAPTTTTTTTPTPIPIPTTDHRPSTTAACAGESSASAASASEPVSDPLVAALATHEGIRPHAGLDLPGIASKLRSTAIGTGAPAAHLLAMVDYAGNALALEALSGPVNKPAAFLFGVFRRIQTPRLLRDALAHQARQTAPQPRAGPGTDDIDVDREVARAADLIARQEAESASEAARRAQPRTEFRSPFGGAVRRPE